MKTGLLIMCFACIETVGASVSFAQKRLFQDVTKNYDPSFRPVLNASKITEIGLKMGLKAILALDEKEETLSCNLFFSLTWWDELLRWNNVSQEDGMFVVKAHQVWTPSVHLFNSVSDTQFIHDSQSAAIWLNGHVTTAALRRLDTVCKVNIEKFPFDQQDCYIQLGSEHPYNGEALVVVDTNVNLDLYEANGEFDVIEASLGPSVLIYEGTPLDIIVVKLSLKRRTTFYILNTILPVVFLSVLNTLVFLLPDESGEKMSLSVSLLLSYAVFLTLINSYLPENSDKVCFFSVYLAMLVIISTLISVTAILIMALQSRLQKGIGSSRLLKLLKTKSDKDRVTAFDSEPKNISFVSQLNNYAFSLFFVLTIMTNLVFFVSSLT